MTILVQESQEQSESLEFKKPRIFNSKLSKKYQKRHQKTYQKKYHEAHHMTSVSHRVVGKFSFDVTWIDVGRTSTVMAHYKGFVDSGTAFPIGKLSSEDLELIVDYDTDVFVRSGMGRTPTAYGYYPIYFVNATKSPKIFRGKDGHAFGIQEAMMKDEGWYAIEYQGVDFCGNGDFSYVVKPSEYVLVLAKKYKGTQKMRLRVRYEMRENLLISQAFEGYINPAQFEVERGSHADVCITRKEYYPFYGAAVWMIK